MRWFKFLVVVLIIVFGAFFIVDHAQKQRKQAVETGLKEAYTTIFRALTQSKDWDGSFDLMLETSYNQTKMLPTYYFAKNYLEPHLVTLKKSYGTECLFKAALLQQFDGSYAKAGLFDVCPTSKYPNFILPNNMTVSVHNSYTKLPQIVLIVDINGKKEPNRIGHDIFYYLVDPHRSNLAFGIGLGCNGFNCGKCGEYAGTDCGGMILRNSWRIPNDYPVQKW